jgi:hypothetical protein
MLDKPEKLAKDKRSSLFGRGINDEEKSFVKLSPEAQGSFPTPKK